MPLITNLDREKKLFIHRSTYVVGDNGNTYTKKRIQIGGRSRINASFPRNIPLKIILEFQDIDASFNDIKLFELKCRTKNYFPVDFPDLHMLKR